MVTPQPAVTADQLGPLITADTPPTPTGRGKTSHRHLVMLSNGGWTSLTALALMRHNQPDARITLLHLNDGHPMGKVRRERVQQIAEHYATHGPIKCEVIEAPDIQGHGHNDLATGLPIKTLAAPRVLLGAMAFARHHKAHGVVWGAACNGDVRATGRASELAMLCEELAGLDSRALSDTADMSRLHLDAPLLDMTDAQVLGLGRELDAPYALTWSCAMKRELACGMCAGCKRRAAAFRAVRMADPSQQGGRRETPTPVMR